MMLNPHLDTSTNSCSTSAFDKAAEHPLLGTPARKKWRLSGFAASLTPHSGNDDDRDDSSNHHWLSSAYRDHNNASPTSVLLTMPTKIETWTVDFSESSNSNDEELVTIFESPFLHYPTISTTPHQDECWNSRRDEIELNGLSNIHLHLSDTAEVVCEDVTKIVESLMQSHANSKRECMALVSTVAALVFVGLLWLWVM